MSHSEANPNFLVAIKAAEKPGSNIHLGDISAKTFAEGSIYRSASHGGEIFRSTNIFAQETFAAQRVVLRELLSELEMTAEEARGFIHAFNRKVPENPIVVLQPATARAAAAAPVATPTFAQADDTIPEPQTHRDPPPAYHHVEKEQKNVIRLFENAMATQDQKNITRESVNAMVASGLTVSA